MAKKKNLGFSLIEVVIAVAVLGLLITPILTQIVQTSNTSRKAKERQAAIENAEYITNFIQKTDKSELDKSSSDGVSDINITGYQRYYDNDGKIECKIVDINGEVKKTVYYNASVYDLDNVKLGPKSNEYTRKAVLDDLSNNVVAAGYSIVYDKNKYTESLKSKGYQLTNEGSIVKHYSDSEDYPDLVKEIVCEERTLAYADSYVNPNKVSLGFIQDLDSTKVAIIQGIASNFDTQVTNEIFSQKMNTLKLNDEDEWNNQVGRTDDTVFANDETGVRLLYVSITAHKNLSNKIDYYEVKCDVCYYDNYTVLGYHGTAKLKYNVYAKKFYTSESPDIYLIYEPYVSDAGKSLYSYNDYIEVYNDADTSDSKLYLIKPSKNQLYGTAYATEEYKNNYVTENNGTIKPVNINIQAALKSEEDIGSKDVIKIYTNLDISYNKDGWDQFSFDNTIRNAGAAAGVDDIKAAQLTELRSMPWPSEITKSASYPKVNLLKLTDDTNISDRLYTVTVILESLDGKMDDVRYTAGKGVD